MALGLKPQQAATAQPPGAFSLTAIQVRSDDEVEQGRRFTRKIFKELREMPGFIGITAGIVGHRLFTTTAWEDLDNPRQIFESKAHREAAAAFFGPELGSGAQTGVWVPHRVNAMWVRCASCGRMADYDKGSANYECGEPLPDPPAYR